MAVGDPRTDRRWRKRVSGFLESLRAKVDDLLRQGRAGEKSTADQNWKHAHRMMPMMVELPNA